MMDLIIDSLMLVYEDSKEIDFFDYALVLKENP